MIFFNKCATLVCSFRLKIVHVHFSNAVTTSPVSMRFVHTNLGTIPSADNAAINGFEFVLKQLCPSCSAIYASPDAPPAESSVHLIDKTAPTRPPHFQLENGSRNRFFKSHIF